MFGFGKADHDTLEVSVYWENELLRDATPYDAARIAMAIGKHPLITIGTSTPRGNYLTANQYRALDKDVQRMFDLKKLTVKRK